MEKLYCIQCKKEFFVKNYLKEKQKYCSYFCSSRRLIGKQPKYFLHDFRGELHPQWRGGKTINSQGYVLVYSPNHPNKNKQNKVREHRLVMEKHLGRYLLPTEDVHHLNGIKNDNRVENLELISKSDHISKYHKREKSGQYKNCLYCGKSFYTSKSLQRLVCCSQSCSTLRRWSGGKEAFGR